MAASPHLLQGLPWTLAASPILQVGRDALVFVWLAYYSPGLPYWRPPAVNTYACGSA